MKKGKGPAKTRGRKKGKEARVSLGRKQTDQVPTLLFTMERTARGGEKGRGISMPPTVERKIHARSVPAGGGTNQKRAKTQSPL